MLSVLQAFYVEHSQSFVGGRTAFRGKENKRLRDLLEVPQQSHNQPSPSGSRKTLPKVLSRMFSNVCQDLDASAPVVSATTRQSASWAHLRWQVIALPISAQDALWSLWLLLSLSLHGRTPCHCPTILMALFFLVPYFPSPFSVSGLVSLVRTLRSHHPLVSVIRRPDGDWDARACDWNLL